MKSICPICNKEMANVGPKIVGYEKSKDPRFTQQQLVAKSVVMCEACLADHKQGKIITRLKKKIS